MRYFGRDAIFSCHELVAGMFGRAAASPNKLSAPRVESDDALHDAVDEAHDGGDHGCYDDDDNHHRDAESDDTEGDRDDIRQD